MAAAIQILVAMVGLAADTRHYPEPANVLLREGAEINGPLFEGDTILIVSLPQKAPTDRLTFVNENPGARGQFEIAIANEKLAAASPNWIPVYGAVSFDHKRRFSVSLLGIEAKYVRLSFHVEPGSPLATASNHQS